VISADHPKRIVIAGLAAGIPKRSERCGGDDGPHIVEIRWRDYHEGQ
jgi:hypothetical protein